MSGVATGVSIGSGSDAVLTIPYSLTCGRFAAGLAIALVMRG